MTQEKHLHLHLSPKELSTMQVLWDTEDALSATEIAERIPNRSWPASSIQSILRSLVKKEAVRVDSITRLGKSFGRLFRPTFSANDYAAIQFSKYYQNGKADCFSLISALLENITADDGEILGALQRLTKEYENKDN